MVPSLPCFTFPRSVEAEATADRCVCLHCLGYFAGPSLVGVVLRQFVLAGSRVVGEG